VQIYHGGSRTKLSITAKGGDKKAELGGLTGNSLGALSAKTVILTGDIDLDGRLASLYLDEISDNVSIETRSLIVYNFKRKDFKLKVNTIGANVDFDLTGSIKSFQAASFGDGSITAAGIGKVKIKYGAFGADVTARFGDILSVQASEGITGDIIANGLIKKVVTKNGGITGVIRAGGDILTVQAKEDIAGGIIANGLIKKVITKAGDITGVIRAGGDILSVQAMNLDNAIISAGHNIKKVTIKADVLDSYILAGYDVGTDGA